MGVLKGSVFFLTALARELTVPVTVDFLGISSFAHSQAAPGMVRISKDLDESIEGENVLLVEDIIDTGFTTRYLLQHLSGRAPKSLAVCTCSIALRAASCKFRWIIAALRFPTGSWWVSGSTTGSSTAI